MKLSAPMRSKKKKELTNASDVTDLNIFNAASGAWS